MIYLELEKVPSAKNKFGINFHIPFAEYAGIFKTIIEDMVVECCLKDANEMENM